MYNNQQYNPLSGQGMGGMQTPAYQPQVQQQAVTPSAKMPPPVMPSYTANPYLAGQLRQGVPQFSWMQGLLGGMGQQGNVQSGTSNWNWSGQNAASPVQDSFGPGQNNPNNTALNAKPGKDQYYYDANGVLHAPNGAQYNALNGNRDLLQAQLGLNKVDGTDYFTKDTTPDMYGWNNPDKSYSFMGPDGKQYNAPDQRAMQRMLNSQGIFQNANGRYEQLAKDQANPFSNTKSQLTSILGGAGEMFGGKQFGSYKDLVTFTKNKANLGLLPDKKKDPAGYAEYQGMMKWAQQTDAQNTKEIKAAEAAAKKAAQLAARGR